MNRSEGPAATRETRAKRAVEVHRRAVHREETEDEAAKEKRKTRRRRGG